jgi:phytoene desaturase
MRSRSESREEAYDVVVVGSGLGGLSAGALLAKAGKKVLVVERHDRPGGYAHSFRRKQYTFDSALHVVSGAESGAIGHALIDNLLRLLGVRDRCVFLPLNPLGGAIFPGFRLTLPAGLQEFIEAYRQYFPNEEKGLRDFMRLCTRINREDREVLLDLSDDDTDLSVRYPLLFEYRQATLGHVMDQYLNAPRLKAALALFWPFFGLPPSRLSFSRWAASMVGLLALGGFYCEGGFGNLANAFAEAVQRHGGEILLRADVRNILVANGRVVGIRLGNGQRIQAPVVISNADATQTFEELVGPEQVPEHFMNRLRRMQPSLSAVTIYAATSLDLRQLGAEHDLMVYESWDHDAVYRQLLEGRPGFVAICVPSLVDSSLAPRNEHVITAMTLAPYSITASWRQEKERHVEALVRRVDTVFPGFCDHLTFLEGASPRTFERYTLNVSGAIFGWEASPEQSGVRGLSRRTPIEGLYLSGHWVHPGAGVNPVIYSGLQTTQLILGYTDVRECLRGLARSGNGAL